MLRPFLALALLAITLLAGLDSAAAAPPVLQAKTYYVESAYDRAVLAQRGSALSRPMASITKLMTVLVALEHARPDELVTVPRAATGIGESTLFLRPGERVTVTSSSGLACSRATRTVISLVMLAIGRESAEPRCARTARS